MLDFGSRVRNPLLAASTIVIAVLAIWRPDAVALWAPSIPAHESATTTIDGTSPLDSQAASAAQPVAESAGAPSPAPVADQSLDGSRDIASAGLPAAVPEKIAPSVTPAKPAASRSAGTAPASPDRPAVASEKSSPSAAPTKPALAPATRTASAPRAAPVTAPQAPSATPAKPAATRQEYPAYALTAKPVGWPSSPFSGPVSGSPLANYGVVEQGVLYRSAKPDEGGYAWLLQRGFKSTVSFQRETGDSTAQVVGLGFARHLWLDIEDENRPTDAHALRFLQFVADPQNWPILMHCKVGLGRTGTMAALARYTFDGWTMEQAIDEARAYRGGKDLASSQMEWLRSWAVKHPRS